MSLENNNTAQDTGAGPAGEAADAWSQEWNNFMGFSFGDTPNGDETGAGDPPAGTAPNSDPQPPPTNGEPAPVNNAPPADQQQPGSTPAPKPDGEQQAAPDTAKGEVIDPAALLAMATGGQQAPAQQQQPQGQPAAVEGAPKEPAAPEEFRPFVNAIQLPQPMMAALFEAEDTETRAAALGGLLQSMGNVIAQVVEQRMKEVHAPAIQAAAVSGFQRQSDAQRVQAEFYGDFPDLNTADYKPIVAKAFEVIAAREPNLTFQEAKAKVGNLARQFIKQTTGVDLTPQQQAPANQAPPAPAQRPKPPGFVANGARPAGTGNPPDPNSPEGVLDELIASGF